MRIQNSLLTQDLHTLIRTCGNNALRDTTELAAAILTPVRADLDRLTHKLSTDIFIAVALYTLGQEEKTDYIPQRMLDCITDMDKWETEKKMLIGISQYTSFSMLDTKLTSWQRDFRERIKIFSNGMAQRHVASCVNQWRKALGLPDLSAKTENEKLMKGKTAILSAHDKSMSLSAIRVGTRFELSDATRLSDTLLKPFRVQTDRATYEFAHNFFIASALCMAHEIRSARMTDVLEFMSDPRWDSVRQIFSHVCNCGDLALQPKTKLWAGAWGNANLALDTGTSGSFVKRSHALWLRVLNNDSTPTISDKSIQAALPPNSIQIFNMAELARAATHVGELREDRKGGADRLLKNAQESDGYRTIPDPKKAHAILENAKGQFENLIEPISCLQKNLILSAAMDPKSFRVRPILLLGDPGIGKTYLAITLAKGLGGSIEKMSAGGAQGNFQLTGSHSSWHTAKCGQVFKALAEGKTTSPVFVIDEIDKMGSDDRYPILPVLLDLFEPGTAVTFKDEFFEMEFDASRIIYILTANSLKNVPEALRSRVEIFTVPRPEPEQRLRIIKEEFKELRAATGKPIKLDKSTSQRLADRTNIDMRRTTSIVRNSFVSAMMKDEKIAKLVIPGEAPNGNGGGDSEYADNKIGFI